MEIAGAFINPVHLTRPVRDVVTRTNTHDEGISLRRLAVAEACHPAGSLSVS
jgi:hypothetical protein